MKLSRKTNAASSHCRLVEDPLPLGMVRQRELEALTRTRNCSPSDFLVTYLELDGNDLGPMIITQKKCFTMILKSISMGGSSQIPIALEAATAIA